ncbi:MAG: glutamine synthetase [Deltaproteobacteria bacterium]|nr:glutamine synthetase [Deltaproteobacteria bacterium]
MENNPKIATDPTCPPLRDFLEIPYERLQELNLASKQARLDRVPAHKVREQRLKYLRDEKRIKAVTVCFSDLEGRFHMLDYDKGFLLRRGDDNLTFDGSSIRGFSRQQESDLRLGLDWPSFYWLPADVFGPGKVLVFGEVLSRDGTPYPGDMRSTLRRYADALCRKDGISCHAANEIEGFVFLGENAERHYHERGKFEFISTGGYYHSLPNAPLRRFIDGSAEVQRAMGFGNEKDHPEVAPSQFEMNYEHTEVTVAADQIQLYKLLCRQVAHNQGMTASFLPKPVAGVNGSGMHTNVSLARKGRNLFHDAKGEAGLSTLAHSFIQRVLSSANDLCLVFNSSVNAYRRLDPHYEAPNKINVSAIDRGAMIRIPLANKSSARIEFRAVSPDANPYLMFYALLRTGLEGPLEGADDGKRPRTRFLPDNIHDALRHFKSSPWAAELLGEELRGRYAEIKQAAADRCPKALGSLVKVSEIQFHHEVTNQYLWNMF